MERQENVRFGKTRTRPEVSLNGGVSSNLEKSKPKQRTDLIDNFHWTIMRARRSKKLTQKQLAENIGETEAIVKSAEEGIMLDNTDAFLQKLESYLGVKLRKVVAEDPAKREIREKFEREAKFDAKTTEALTIADLQEMKKKKESEGKGFFSFLKKKKKKDEDKSEKDEDMSDEEAEEILFKG
jgi:ribosome-binding protein aMBF1 (putative translation factor)